MNILITGCAGFIGYSLALKQQRLLDSCKNFFEISLVKRETYNPNKFEELDKFSDEERLIAFGEGRENNMNWLILTPKKF